MLANLPLIIYLTDLISSLHVLSLACLVISIAVAFIMFMFMMDTFRDEERVKWWKRCQRSIMVAIFCLFSATFIPEKSTIYAMLGAYAANEISANPTVERLSGKVMTLLEGKMDEIINEAANAGKKSTSK